ncbi:MAG: DUF192 domain-containing protein [Cyanobacteria bacterium]|nr:DUF192 domain-containing protein [Cyanobacteriota bacterium]
MIGDTSSPSFLRKQTAPLIGSLLCLLCFFPNRFIGPGWCESPLKSGVLEPLKPIETLEPLSNIRNREKNEALKNRPVSPPTSTAKINTETTSESDMNPQASSLTLRPKKLPRIKAQINGELFYLEVASTLNEQLKGLMFRTHLPQKEGMLFPFSPPRGVNFWMKNCKIPLDMVFVRNGVVVHVINSALPCVKDPCPVYPSKYPVDTVIELPAGSALSFVIQPGDPVQFLSPGQIPSSPQTGEAPRRNLISPQ